MFRFGNRALFAAVAQGVAIVALPALLSSCNVATVGGTTTAPSDVDVLDKVRSLDILPRGDQPVSSIDGGGATTRVSARTYQGTEIPDVAEARAQPSANGRGYDLNFENTPVATVAKVVLGDILGTGYAIDPRVQGTVSLVSARPVPKSDIIFVLESALRLSGIVLVRDAAGYRLTPLGDAVGAGRIDAEAANPEPGYGVSVVPLQYVGAQTILKLMDSFATRAGSVRADSTRNLLLIQGTGAERRTAVDTALSFDVDWMRGQSVGIYPINNSAPEPMIAELEKIMDTGENGMSQNLVKFQIISRLNAIMVVSRKPALLQTAATWIHRLDRADAERTSVRVYHIRYGDARQLAHVLNDMFVGGASSSLDSAENQLAPGSGGATASVADRLSFNTNASNSSANSNSRMQIGGGLGSSQPAVTPNQSAATPGNNGADTHSSGGQPVTPNVRITPDVVNNALLIYADQESYRMISSTLQQLDRPVLQVAIDATIAEVTLNNQLTYGVQFFLSSKTLGSAINTQSAAASTASTTTSAATDVATTAASAAINRVLPGFNFLIGSEASPKLILDALHSVTSVKVLSNPSLVVINNQTATLQVGDVVPISTGSATVLTTNNTVVNTIDYRNTGIILRVVPRITANGNVQIDVEQEISNVAATAAATLTPTVTERKVKSSISVANGQTVLLAGLISEQQDGDRNGIPLLDELPGLGDAFSHQNKTGTRTELIIFIRPQIIRDGSDAHNAAEELRSKLRGSVGASITDDLRVHTVR